MTTIDVVYNYGAPPTEAAALGLSRLREIYGIRRVHFSGAEKTVCVEYDSTRLSESVILQLLRRGGLDVLSRVTTPEKSLVADSDG